MHSNNNSQNSKADNKSSIVLSDYLVVIRRRKYTILLTILFFLALGLTYVSKSTPIYRATTKLQADPVQPNATAQDQYVMSSMVFLFYETQYEVITSRRVAESVVDKLNLVDRYKNDLIGESTSDNFSIFSEILKILNPESDSTQLHLSDDKIRTMLAQGIAASLNVGGGTQSQVINISFEHEDPVLAANIVNSVGEAYIQFGLESRLSQIKDTASWLSEQLEDLRISLQKSEDKLRNFRLAQNLMDTEQQQRLANTQLQTLNTELVKAQTQLSEAKDIYLQVEQIEETKGNYLSIDPVLQSSIIKELVREEAVLSRKVEELSKRYGERHPKMIAARSDLASASTNISREASKIIENVKKQYRSAQAQEQNIRDLIADTRNSLQSYQGNSFELTRLEREVENNRRIYESFLNKLMEADVSGEYDATNIRVIDTATVPEYPVKPRKILVLISSVILGSILGLSFALLREFAGGVIRTPDQLEEELVFQSLGVTPIVEKRNRVSPEMQYLVDQRSTFSEAINTIRTGILLSNITSPPKSILVTSTNAAEGKTTLAINLATAMSQLEKTVLIELDLRKPAISKDLNLPKGYGLTEYVEGIIDDCPFQALDDAPNLDILTCGKIPENPTELISSTRFKTLLEALYSKYTYVVIDSPPTLPVTDSCIISKLADVTVLAVKAESTKVNAVKETLARLNKVNANIAGLVLTQASPEKMSYYGDHYYRNTYYGEER